MMTLVSLATGFLNNIRMVVGLVVPLFAEASDFKKWPGWLKALVGLVLFAVTCFFFWWLQRKLPAVDRWLLTRAPDAFRPYFLATAFVVVVASFWLAHGLYTLLTSSDDDTEFADVKFAWEEAVRRLTRDGYRPADLPLFLVLGRPTAGLDRLFLASGAAEIVRTPGDPRGGSAPHPLRVYAWDKGIFVTCPGASGWGQFCHKLSFGEDDVPLTPAEDGGATSDPYKTINFGAGIGGLDPLGNQRFQELTRKANEVGLTPAEKAEHRELYEAAEAAVTRKRPTSLTADEQELHLRRLKYLCRLIARERQPWCPVNGLVVLVPWEATGADETARNAAGVLAQELRGVREAFRLRYPTFALVTDLETADGFKEFQAGFLPEMLKQRLGQKLPLVPEFKGAAGGDPAVDLVRRACGWIGLSVVPAFILRFLSLEGRRPDHTADKVAVHNRKLYTLMRSVFDRGPRLGVILAEGVPAVGGGDDVADLPLFGGCYLTATGDGPQSQAFVPGAFAKLFETQDKVSWAPDALAEDARLRQWAAIGWGGTAMLGLLIVAWVAILLRK